MLEQITIKNFVLIEDATLNFNQNLNILIGETGGGKSLVFRAISQLFGGRGQKKYIKQEANAYEISAIFSNNEVITQKLQAQDIEIMDKLYVTRKFNQHSQNRITVNGEIISLNRLTELMHDLAEFTMQNEHRKLTNDDYLNLLNPEAKLLNDYQKELRQYQKLIEEEKALIILQDNVEEETLVTKHRLQELKLLEEITNPDLLQQEVSMMSNQLNNINIYQETNQMIQTLQHNLVIDGKLPEAILAKLYTIEEELAEISYSLTTTLDSQISETEFNKMQELYSSYKRIERKYNLNFDELQNYYQELLTKQEQLSSVELDLVLIQQKVEKQTNKLEKVAMALATEMKAKAKQFILELTPMLSAVGLEKALIKFEFKRLKQYRMTGMDEIKLVIDVNNKNYFGDINTTLSGGEFARILLLLKVINPQNDDRVLLLFDEIDTGISGKVAQKIAKLIKKLSRNNQIILITHLAQTAASGDKLFKIIKNDGISSVNTLNPKEHYLEIAKLLSGSEVTKAAKEQAQKLIEEVK